MKKAGRSHFRFFILFSVVLLFVMAAFSWRVLAENAQDDEGLEAEAKGNQDLQMIAKQMEFLSGRLNRMPTPPKMDATFMINPGNEYVSEQGGQGNAEDNGQDQRKPATE